MPLEAGSFISDLNASNPGASDGLGQGDDHIRLIKSAVKNTFTAMNAATDVAPGTLNDLEDGIFEFADGTLTAPALRSATEPTLGIHRVAAGKLGLSQGKRFVGNGFVPVGSLHHFPKLPPAGTYTSGGVATANPERIEYIESDGAVYNIADFPDLGAYLLDTFGGNGISTFGVPDEKTVGRFRRSRTASVSVGTFQSDVIKNHVHTFTSNTDGAHGHTGTTDSTANSFTGSQRGIDIGAGPVNAYVDEANQTGGDSASGFQLAGMAHTHTITIASQSAHAHSGTTNNNTGGSADETRPFSFVCFACIKT